MIGRPPRSKRTDTPLPSTTPVRSAEAGGGEVAGNAVDAQAILAGGGDGDIDHRVVEPAPLGEAGSDRRIGGQLDDAVMLLAQLQLAHGAHPAPAPEIDTASGRGEERQYV